MQGSNCFHSRGQHTHAKQPHAATARMDAGQTMLLRIRHEKRFQNMQQPPRATEEAARAVSEFDAVHKKCAPIDAEKQHNERKHTRWVVPSNQQMRRRGLAQKGVLNPTSPAGAAVRIVPGRPNLRIAFGPDTNIAAGNHRRAGLKQNGRHGFTTDDVQSSVAVRTALNLLLSGGNSLRHATCTY